MKFTSVVLTLAAVVPFAAAGDYLTTSVSTFYSTKTVYLVHTEVKTGTPPASTSCNTTSTYSPSSYASVPTYSSALNHTVSGTGAYYPTGTGVLPTGPSTTGAVPTFTGAASHLNANALVAAIAAGVGYLAL